MRAISFEHFNAPSTPIFTGLKILKLNDLFQLRLLSFVFDCINKISPSYFHSFFELVDSIHQYCTRQASKNDIFLIQKNTLQYGLRPVRFYGAKCWNGISMEIKKSPTANNFRRKLRANLFASNYWFLLRKAICKRSLLKRVTTQQGVFSPRLV